MSSSKTQTSKAPKAVSPKQTTSGKGSDSQNIFPPLSPFARLTVNESSAYYNWVLFILSIACSALWWAIINLDDSDPMMEDAYVPCSPFLAFLGYYGLFKLYHFFFEYKNKVNLASNVLSTTNDPDVQSTLVSIFETDKYKIATEFLNTLLAYFYVIIGIGFMTNYSTYFHVFSAASLLFSVFGVLITAVLCSFIRSVRIELRNNASKKGD